MSDASETAAARSRRSFLGASNTAPAAARGVAAAIAEAAAAQSPSRTAGRKPQGLTDADIFNFALNLEYLETEYYMRGLTGQGMNPAMAGPAPGPVRGGGRVQFQNPMFRQFLENIARNENGHVNFLRRTLGTAAISRPKIDFEAGFAAVARAAGRGSGFDPFADETSFLLGGYLFEDVGITVYKGAAPWIRNRDYLKAAAGIHAAEGYHMGVVRSVLYRKGPQARDWARRISDLRDSLDGPVELDQPLELGGMANIVPSDSGGVTFSRTPAEVLNIVYGQSGAGITSGGFFPDGLAGRVRST